MKKLFLLSICLLILCVQGHSQSFGNVFNDTILFQLIQLRPLGNGDARMMFDFQTAQGSQNSMTGKIVLSMFRGYCDSLWDEWPADVNDPIPGGTATLEWVSSSSQQNSGPLQPGNTGKPMRGRLNIWKAPAGIQRNDPFTLPVMFIVD